MGGVILFLLVIATTTFIIYAMIKTGKDLIKERGSYKKIKPKDVIKIVEPIKKVYSKLMPDGSLIESSKVVGEKVTYLFKRSNKERKKMNQGVLDRDFSKYQQGIKNNREEYINRDAKKGGKK